MVDNIAQVENYFELTDLQRSQFVKLHSLHISLRERLNLISRGDVEHLWTRHILHSLAIARFLPTLDSASCLDIGTGGGFPAIPLAILLPQYSFIAIDGTHKKIRAVEEIIDGLSLSNVRARAVRAEELNGSFDFVLARAVAPLPKLLSWSQSLLASGGRAFYLKGGDLTEEIKEVSHRWATEKHSLAEEYNEPFFAEKFLLEIHDKMPV